MTKRKGPVVEGIDYKDLWEVVKEVQAEAQRFAATELREEDEDTTSPGYMELTIGWDASGWTAQTGDNSYTGPVYGYRNWAVTDVPRRGAIGACVEDLAEQLRDYEAYEAPMEA